MTLARTLSWILFTAILATALGWLLTPWVAAATALLIPALLLIRQARILAQLQQWTFTPEATPPALGDWDALTAPLYRYLKARRLENETAQDTMQSMLAAAQALPDGVVTLDRGFHIDWCNRTAQRHLGLRMPMDQSADLRNLLRSPGFIEYAAQDRWPEPVVVRVHLRDRERRLLMQLATFGRDQRLLITRDVTQLERLETTRRDFVANVSHELRTPLTVLVGFLETLRDMPADALSAEQRTHYMTLMYDQGQVMQALVADLLTLSTLESAPSQEGQAIRCDSLLATPRQQVESLSAGKHVFSWHIDPDLQIRGSETELASAVSNLLTNAVRYTPEGGTISVTFEATPDGGARYVVTDTGIGIAAHHIDRLTERFYRVDRSRSRAAGGTGLGLAITKHIAMRHDAELEITSVLGQGSTFALVFPPERVGEKNPHPAKS
ncbi:phosphate regulon sensor histidine kinase PhoR [Corticimicrobacter populi]|uniref:Phosphate regulon sensor protein PhoR n=1 Tax=Corticimicrobacter populi TaxID=2175229 RepID=A0A2V1K1E9_9BURK|nr:phosphate regulon sensor histidine kinase PhoR [Corticimicrobacter populi]PWF23916.1 phosphate regulon sensor histidine kinase PhoR [Corticimicrobacter populi]